MDFVRRSPESRIALAWSQRSLDAELRNLGDGSRIATLSALRRDEHDPLSVAFSPQGDVVATWSLYQPGTKLWDTASGRSIHVIDDDDGSLDRVEFSSDGSLLVTTSGSHGIRLWEGKTGNSRPSWNSVQPTTGLILSGPLGHRFLVESPEEGILLINGDSGQRIQRLGNVDERIGLVQFSTTGEFLLTATSSREELVIWNAVTGDRLATVRQTDRPFVRAEFTHDGQWIVTCEQDGTTRVWPMDVAGFAKRHVPRDLYSAERELFGIK